MKVKLDIIKNLSETCEECGFLETEVIDTGCGISDDRKD